MVILPKRHPISWWHVVVSLERLGYTHAAIAAAIDSTRSTVESWKNRGVNPPHFHGELLIGLWREVTGNAREDLPRRPGIVSAAKISQPVRRVRSAA